MRRRLQEKVYHRKGRALPDYGTTGLGISDLESLILSAGQWLGRVCGSVSWWVPASDDPVGSDEQCIGIVRQVECSHRSTSDRRLADDPQAIGRPLEMLGPDLSTRIQKGSPSPVSGSLEGPIGLIPIAQRAAQPEVGFLVASSLGPGEEVLDLEARHHQMLGAQAVATTIPGEFPDAAVDFDGQAITRHGRPAELSARPRPLPPRPRVELEALAIQDHELIETPSLLHSEFAFASPFEQLAELFLRVAPGSRRKWPGSSHREAIPRPARRRPG